jgi:hypothetical protein
MYCLLSQYAVDLCPEESRVDCYRPLHRIRCLEVLRLVSTIEPGLNQDR